MLYIKRVALESALEGAKNTYPDEFIALIRGEDRGADTYLTELIIAPFSSYDKDSSSYSPFYIPANSSEKASFHSHPSGGPLPSRQDLRYFAHTGGFHFIAAPPYGLRDMKAYDSGGKKVEFAVVD